MSSLLTHVADTPRPVPSITHTLERGAYVKISDATQTIKATLCGGGGGGAGGSKTESGPSGGGGDVVVVVFLLDSTTKRTLRYAIGEPGKGGPGRLGGTDGGDTKLFFGDEVVIARGGRGGRASGVFLASTIMAGNGGAPGVILLEEFTARLPDLVAAV